MLTIIAPNLGWIIIFLSSLQLITLEKPLKPPLEFCEVLKDLQKYRGKVIEVRGVWISNTVSGRCTPLKTGSHVWTDALWLEIPQDGLNAKLGTDEQVYWTVDRDEWNQAEATATRLEGTTGTGSVSATFIGRLDTREKLEVYGEEQGFSRPQPNGYGHLAQYPGRLMIIAVRDVRLTSE